MAWLDSVFWWVGGTVCAFGAGLIAALLLMATKEAVIAAGHVIKFYRCGMVWSAKLPFLLFWHFFWSAPRYVVRKEPFAVIYRPFAKPLPGDEHRRRL